MKHKEKLNIAQQAFSLYYYDDDTWFSPNYFTRARHYPKIEIEVIQCDRKVSLNIILIADGTD